MNPHKSKSGLARIWRALLYSRKGLRDAWRHEHAFRQELILVLCLAPVIVFAPVSLPERAALAASLLLVLIVELLNSAIEAVVDRVSLDEHELSGRAKDMGSAAVLFALVLAGVVWVAILFPVARALLG
ncbi:MAG: diacylglycerol kinase [Burkholderiaceae bacterium]|nr:diacylglycerol kinase [Burkholderiaceae bacterium]